MIAFLETDFVFFRKSRIFHVLTWERDQTWLSSLSLSLPSPPLSLSLYEYIKIKVNRKYQIRRKGSTNTRVQIQIEEKAQKVGTVERFAPERRFAHVRRMYIVIPLSIWAWTRQWNYCKHSQTTNSEKMIFLQKKIREAKRYVS